MPEPTGSPGERDLPEEVVVIGREQAAALLAEQRHQQAREGGPSSPLEGVGYDLWAGHHDLLRFADAAADETVRALVSRYGGTDADERAGIRAALTMDDFYTLCAFARRCAVRALRARDAQLAADAVTAMALIDRERIDWRDILWTLGLATHALRSLTADADSVLRRARDMAEPEVQELLERFIEASDEDAELANWGYMEVESPAGPGFVGRGLADYAPTYDLIDLASRIADVIESDTYRVSSISAGEELPAVWLPGAAAAESEPLVEACRGCVTLHAVLDPDAHPSSDAQGFYVFVVETRDAADARRLHDWAATTAGSSHHALRVRRGPLLCLVVARSQVVGVEPFETDRTMARFLAPLDAIVATVVGST